MAALQKVREPFWAGAASALGVLVVATLVTLVAGIGVGWSGIFMMGLGGCSACIGYFVWWFQSTPARLAQARTPRTVADLEDKANAIGVTGRYREGPVRLWFYGFAVTSFLIAAVWAGIISFMIE